MRGDLKYCIWGCGNRGKHIFHFMRGKGVQAFIDSNENLQGTAWQGVPVISFDTYQEKFRDCIVIISAFVEDEIRERLRRGRIPYFSAQMLPPEMVEAVCEDLFPVAERRVRREGVLYLYGLNLYSVLLAEFLERRGRRVKIIPPRAEAELRAKIERVEGADCFCNLDEAGDHPIYVTSNEYDMDALTGKNPVELYDFLYDIEAFHKPYLEKYKDIHRGRRCFVIGTGPSLRMEDLDRLKESGEICIGVNGIVRAYPFTGWRPTYYILNGMGALREWGDELVGECRTEHMFMPDNMEYPHQEIFEIYHLSRLQADLHCPPFFSRDFSRGCYAFGVTYCALQLAAYMGFSEIYLYGIDFYYNRQRPYFTPDYSKSVLEMRKKDDDSWDKVYDRDMLRSKAAYQSARRAMEERGFTIYNASRETALDVFELVDFDKLI